MTRVVTTLAEGTTVFFEDTVDGVETRVMGSVVGHDEAGNVVVRSLSRGDGSPVPVDLPLRRLSSKTMSVLQGLPELSMSEWVSSAVERRIGELRSLDVKGSVSDDARTRIIDELTERLSSRVGRAGL